MSEKRVKINPQEVSKIQHLPESFFATAKKQPCRPAQWTRNEAGDYIPTTYAQLAEQVQRVASGLAERGVNAGDHVAILMENRSEWAVADYAILTLGAVTVPLYCSYRPQDISFVLNDADVTIVIASGGTLLEHLIKSIESCPKVKSIYAIDPNDDHRVTAFSSLQTSDIDLPRLLASQSKLGRDTLATLVYTSGTTANPKGVMLSHGNLLTNIESAIEIIAFHDHEKMLSFLPLAHCFERLAGHFLVYGLGLSVAFAERPDSVVKNMQEAEPTILITVPRLLEVIRARILAQVGKQSFFNRFLFDRLLSLADRRFDGKLPLVLYPLWSLLDRLIGKKIRCRFGGHIHFMISGGAPLSQEVGRFFEQIKLPILQGYGLTESSPLITVNPFEDRKIDATGVIPTNIKAYIANDGEVIASGGNIMQGYWKQPVATAEALRNGHLHTGDIGHIDADGFLHITDRKKDIIVNSGGENIAPQRVESRLIANEMITQAAVFGDQRPYLVALIVPDREAVTRWAKTAGIPKSGWKELVASGMLRKEIQSQVTATLKPLTQHEQVRRIHLIPEPFSVEDGFLTPTMKIKRRKVYKHFNKVIEELY
ncbi:MAG: long-chain fatty acid--CoA ligase [Mariprofundaceae bacterium]